MKITRYLWINNLSSNCEENDIRQTFQSHGKIQTIRIHKNNNSRGAIVAFIDCKSSTKAFESVKTLMDLPLKLEYCEANGEPGINYLGNNGNNSSENQKIIIEKSNHKQSTKTSTSSRSRSNSSNTSSFGSSIDDCSKYPGIQQSKRVDENSNNYESNDNEKGKLSNNNNNNSDSTEADKQCLNKELCGLLIENLSQRSSDTSLREGLFHEYKKHGKITSVTVMGQASGRYAIISFKRSEDMEKAFEASQGKIFFGNLIKAKQHNGFNYIDPDLCPPEHAMDEYHPKATKTLFVGKLTTGSVTESDLKKSFKKFGEIIDIDIKTQSNQPDTSFAFVQYYDISSVVRALRNQDNIKIDSKSVKLGFGKSQPTNCLWIGNLQRNANDAFLRRHFRRYGPIMIVIPDPEFSCALIQFDCVEDAQRALTDTRERSNGNGNNNNNKRMQVDYASNEYQMAFMNRLRKSCQFDSHDLLKSYADPYQTEKIQNLLISYTKYLGLLEETRPQSFERYENKSDYEDTYDEVYTTRQSRHRKSAGGHQRLYGSDNYGLDEEYSDDYRYSKSSVRHYDDYSPTHSPVRYSRSSQKFSSEQYNSRKSNYRYNSDYYDGKRDQVASSNSYYPHRRSPEPAGFIHSNHNRSYSPSPSSSTEYCVENSRFNLTTKRYRQTSKEYRSSRSKVADNHETRNGRFERTSENRSWNKSNRYDYNGYVHYRSKSNSHSRLSGSNSPHSRHSVSQQRSYRNESAKKNRSHKIVNNASVTEHTRLSTQKTSSKTTSISKLIPSTYSTKTSSNNSNADMSGLTLLDPAKLSINNSTSIVNAAASQSADTLSKLERERAKLLQELSMLSEDGSGAGLGSSNKINKSSSKLSDLETRSGSHKSQKKHSSPLVGNESSQSGKRSSGLESKLAAVTSVLISPPPSDCSSQSQFLSSDMYKTVKDPPDLGIEIIKLEPLSTNSLDVIVKLEPTLPTKDVILMNSSMDLFDIESSASKVVQSMTVPSNMDVICSDSIASVASTSATNQCRDPRLSSTNYNIRSLSSSLCPLSPVEHNLPMLVAISISTATTTVTTIVNTTSISSHYPDSGIPTSIIQNSNHASTTVIPLITSSYKDSTSDSDLDHFSNIDNEVDKRIRELDAKLNRSEQTVRTLDYSKFRIRKKVCDIGNCSTSYNSISNSSGLISSPTCLSAPTTSLSVTSNLLDVGYSGGITRDNNSNTSEFIKTMLNQTKPKSYHLLADSLPSSDHLTCNYSTVVSTNSSLPFRTVDLGANDIERRTLYSRFGSLSSNNLPLLDIKLSVDTTHLSPTINTHSSKFVSTTSSISNSKMPSIITISPTATISSTTSTPTILHDSNQPMKSILKKSIPTTPTLSKPSSDTIVTSKFKTSLSSSLDCSSSNESKPIPKKSTNPIKRKSQSESEDSVEYCKPSKKIKIESGPTLDDSLFPTYPSAPIKKLKKSSKNSFSSSSSAHLSKYDSKSSNSSKRSPSNIVYSNSSNTRNSIGIEKSRVSKKSAKINQSNHSNQKSTKLYKDKKKSSSKLSINKKTKAKVVSNRKNKQMKSEKIKKSSKRNKEREFYDNNIDNAIKEDDIEDDNNDDLSEFDDDFDKESGSSDNGNYESMYDKIKRRNSTKSVSSGKKRRNKHLNSLVNAASSDAMDSDDSEYWISKSSKKCIPSKRKRARLSDLSSSHFSDSNSCKTTPCGKSQEPHLSSDYSDIKSDIVHQNNFYHMKVDENTKDESVTDESKAPAESFNLSSPHNSSQCSSPKYVKDVNLMTINKDAECNNFTAQSILASYRTRSLHRPNDGPLKKRPIAEPIILSEDLPYLEKQPDDEFITTSPTSINEEPPSQLESMYDVPSSQQTNVLEEVVLDDHQDSLDVVEVEYGSHDLGNDQNPIEIDPPLPADVDSASHILMTMKTQPNIELEYANITSTNNEPDHQIQSVAEHLISLAQNSIVSSIGLPQLESAVMVTEEEKQSQIASTRACKVTNPNSKQKDYEVTTYVKNIIDKIKKETDLANLMNKDKLVCKRNKKSTASTVGLAKPMNQESRQLIVVPVELDSTNRVTTAATVQPIEPVVTSSNCTLLPVPQPHELLQQKTQLIKPIEAKKPILLEESASTSSTGRRTRHNSAKSDCQLQSLDETIDNVVKSSMSSSISDAVSNKSTLDGDINPDGETIKSNPNDINSATKSGNDLSSLEETMNEVIHKMSSCPPCSVANSSAQSVMADSEINKPVTNNIKVSISNQEICKQKKVNVNHVKPPMYQLSGNMGSITNLLLGIPSILTVNCQTNALGQNKMPSQLTLPISKLAVSTIQSNIVSASTLVPSSITLHNQQNSITSVQSTEVMMTKLNSLTPIMIPAPLRNLTPLAHNNSNLSNQSLIASRPLSNPVCGTIMSVSNSNMPLDNSSSKLINVTVPIPNNNKPITSPINVVPRSPITPNPGLNLSKMPNSVDMISNYILLQRQVNQTKSKMPNMCQQSTSNDNNNGLSQNVPAGLTASISNTGHSIILSQLTHANSVLSPINTAYLTASVNRTTNSTGNLLQSLPTTNGISAGIQTNPVVAAAATQSVILRPINIPFPKFDEKDDWLKQNKQIDLTYPIRWTGKLCLKNDEVFVQMHMIAGNEDLIKNSMNLISNGQNLSQPLRIVQRMRLEPNQLEGLQRRLTRPLEFCTCLTLAGGDKLEELTQISSILNDNFIKYLQEKSAAGIINICIPESQQNAYVIHIFPPCEFSDNQLKNCCSKLYDKLKEESVPYLLVVITTV